MIGVIDSGVGGLSVLKELRQAMPQADFFYLGDTARNPYGTRSPEEIKKYSLQLGKWLLAHEVTGLVVACNT
ncbi:MAG: Glutamate racemase, partial [Negativicoccus succinicivorans DORA_17_25]